MQSSILKNRKIFLYIYEQVEAVQKTLSLTRPY